MMTKKSSATKDDWQKKITQAPFEEAMDRLEEIVAQMEDSQLPLEEAMRAYEEGVYLIKHCKGKLEEAEAKIEMLEKIPDQERADKGDDQKEMDGESPPAKPGSRKNKNVRKKNIEINQESGEPIVGDHVQGSLLDF